MQSHKVLNFAHRGFRSKYPENTMLSFEKAVNLGVDGLEFDIHLSKDGIPVIIHDETINRTTDSTGYVRELNFKELKKLNVAANFASSNLNEKIPGLEEYFDFIKNKDIISNIELKNGIFAYEGIEEKVYELIKKYQLDEKCIISSFNHESIFRMKKIAPHLKYGFLTDSWEINPIPYLQEYKIQCYHPSAYRLSAEFVARLHAENIQVNTWFSAVPLDYKSVIETGVDVIISDEPDKIAKLLAKTNSQQLTLIPSY